MSAQGTAVVAGGSAGVGRAVVDMLLARGHRVAVIARGEDRLDELQDRFGRDRLMGISCDAADAAGMSQAAREVRDAFGPVTIWVNSVMLTSYSPFREVPAEEFDAIVGATFLGTVNGTRAALEVMERGAIVNVGSGLSYRAVPMQSAYVAAKHAINGFTSALRSELIREGRPVTLSLVQLPAINTPQFDWSRNRLPEKPQPAPPIFQPEVAARAILRAADRGEREVFVGGSVLQLVFGDMAAPALLDRFLARNGVEAQQSGRPPVNRVGNVDRPVAMASRAHGSHDEDARSSALVVDGDRARAAAFIGVPLVTFALGALIAGARRR